MTIGTDGTMDVEGRLVDGAEPEEEGEERIEGTGEDNHGNHDHENNDVEESEELDEVMVESEVETNPNYKS